MEGVENFCRGCLIQYEGPNELIQYTEKNRRQFVYCTGLQVKRNDSLTFQLCKECLSNMKSSCKFKKLCRTSDKRFKNFIAMKEAGDTVDFCSFLKNTDTIRFPYLNPYSTPLHQKEASKDDDNESTCTSIRNFMRDILKPDEIPDTEARIIREVIAEEADIMDDSLDSQWLQDDLTMDDLQLDFTLISPFSTPRSTSNGETPSKNDNYVPKYQFTPRKPLPIENIENRSLPILTDPDYIPQSQFLPKRIEGEVASKNLKRRLPEDVGENVPPKKIIKIRDATEEIELESADCMKIIEIAGKRDLNKTSPDTIDKNLEAALNDNAAAEFSLDDLITSPAHFRQQPVTISTPTINSLLFDERIDLDQRNDKETSVISPDLEMVPTDIHVAENDEDPLEIDPTDIKIAADDAENDEDPLEMAPTDIKIAADDAENDDTDLGSFTIPKLNFYVEVEKIEDEEESKKQFFLVLQNKESNSTSDTVEKEGNILNSDETENTVNDETDHNVTVNSDVTEISDWNIQSQMEEYVLENLVETENSGFKIKLKGQIEENTKIIFSKEQKIEYEPGKKGYHCSLCERDFKKLIGFQVHCDKIHGLRYKNNRVNVKYNVCTNCGKSIQRSNFGRHKRACAARMERKENKVEFQCDFCKLSFKLKHNLVNHMKVHMRIHSNGKKHIKTKDSEKTTEKKKYNCEICGSSTNNPSNFRVHVMRHEKKYTVHCVICNKGFYRARDLDLHMASHTKSNINSFECAICGKCYSRRDNLNTHIISAHTGTKPYTCNFCSTSFFSGANLREHMRSNKTCLNKRNIGSAHKIIIDQSGNVFKHKKIEKNLLL